MKDEASYGTMLYYAMDKRHVLFVQLRIELNENVVRDQMEKAFEKTCKRFPYFLTTLSEEDNCIVTVPNPKTPVVHYDQPDYVIDYKENDGFLIRLSATDNLIVFSFFHGLTDGAGAFNFLKVLLCEYYKNLGEKVKAPEDLFDINAEPSSDEYAEPLSNVPEGLAYKSKDNDVFQIKAKKSKNYQAYRFSLSQEKMMEHAAATGGSPNSISQIEIAQAIMDTYPEAKKIGVSTSINAKPFVNFSASQKPCISVSDFTFDEQTLSMDKKELNKLVRNKIKEDVKYENILTFFAGTKKLFEIMSYMDDIKAKHIVCAKVTAPSVATIIESYVGQIQFGSIEKHIKAINSFCDSPQPLVEINFINGRFYYSISCGFEIDSLVNNLCKRFNELGFECSEPEKFELKTYLKEKDPVRFGLNVPTFKMLSAIKKFKEQAKK